MDTFCTPIQIVDNQQVKYINYSDTSAYPNSKTNLINIRRDYFNKYFIFKMSDSDEKINKVINKVFDIVEYYACCFARY